jgi:prepilin-type N-terminal cleavage/methylation domain-containing protein
MTRYRPARRAGVTLLEMLLVLALLVIIASIAVPSFQGYSPYFKTTAAVDQVRGRWNDARAKAIEQGRPYRFAIKPGDTGFRIAPDDPEFWGGSSSGSSNDADDPSMRPFIVEDDLDGVTFSLNPTSNSGGGGNNANPNNGNTPNGGASTSGSVSANGWTQVVVFLPDGTTDVDVDMQLAATGTRPMGLKIRSLTGAITATRPKEGEK